MEPFEKFRGEIFRNVKIRDILIYTLKLSWEENFHAGLKHFHQVEMNPYLLTPDYSLKLVKN